MILLHVTAAGNINSIIENGLDAGSYLTNSDDIADYYADVIHDEGDEPITLEIDLDTLNKKGLKPDKPGLEEPITSALDMDEDEIWDEWMASKKKWQDSLEIVHSVFYTLPIPSNLIRVRQNPS